MAVVPMQKVQLVVHESDLEAALAVVQQVGALEFEATKAEAATRQTALTFPNMYLLPRVQHAVQFLGPYAPERGLWQKLREGSQIELSEQEVVKKLQDTDGIELVVEDLERLQVEFAENNEKIRSLEEQYRLLQDWKALPLPLAKLTTKHTRTLLLHGRSLAEKQSLAELVTHVLSEAAVPHVLTEVSLVNVAVTIPIEPDTGTKVQQLLENAEVTVVTPPLGVETPEIEFVAVSEELAKARSQQALWLDQVEHFALTHLRNLQVAVEVLSWQRDRYTVTEAARATKHTVVLEGWLVAHRRSYIEERFAAQGIAASITDLELSEGEEPPVEIENGPLIKPFEAVTRLYGMPGYKDLDPTVFLAGFFFLFFGMSLTDVGYGLFLMVVSAIILTLFKVAPPIRLFAKLLLFVGFATVLVGLLFGGYLGIPPEHIPEFLKKLQVYDPIGNPLPVFYTALGLGVVQVMAGMVIKIYSDYRNNRLMEGVLDQGPWLFVFCVGILYLGVSAGVVSFLVVEQVVNLIYVGIAMIILSSARKGDSIVGRVRSALLSLYDSIGYFSDILSYSRLLALGLATTALAFAVNLIAGMVVDVPFVGAILALAILIIGHLFTLAVNTLGAFIHSARLQFVEFFGKFIAGTGRSFAPLSRTEKHVTVRDE